MTPPAPHSVLTFALGLSALVAGGVYVLGVVLTGVSATALLAVAGFLGVFAVLGWLAAALEQQPERTMRRR